LNIKIYENQFIDYFRITKQSLLHFFERMLTLLSLFFITLAAIMLYTLLVTYSVENKSRKCALKTSFFS